MSARRDCFATSSILPRPFSVDLAGVDRDSFLSNGEKQDPVLRCLEIIGEAASRLDDVTRSKLPALPFRSMRGMRNIIAHDYGEVDIEQVWITVSRDLPTLFETPRRHFE